MCTFGGSLSGMSSEPFTNWQTAYDQLTYLLPDTMITTTATNLEVDLYNEALTVVAAIQIVGYSGSDPGSSTPPSCANPSGNLNQDCLVA